MLARVSAALVASLLVLGSGAQATVLTFDFAGVWTNDLAPDGMFSGSFSYDTAAPSVTSATEAENYLGIEFTIDALDDGAFVAEFEPLIAITDNFTLLGGLDFVQIGGAGASFSIAAADLDPLFSDGVQSLTITLTANSGDLFAGTALPGDLRLEDYPSALLVVPNSSGELAFGDITSLSLREPADPIPVPGGLVLFITGSALLIRHKR
ncbi:MAG: hypothetical protein AAFX52_12705 [Pseudomonadota bacterium]